MHCAVTHHSVPNGPLGISLCCQNLDGLQVHVGDGRLDADLPEGCPRRQLRVHDLAVVHGISQGAVVLDSEHVVALADVNGGTDSLESTERFIPSFKDSLCSPSWPSTHFVT